MRASVLYSMRSRRSLFSEVARVAGLPPGRGRDHVGKAKVVALLGECDRACKDPAFRRGRSSPLFREEGATVRLALGRSWNLRLRLIETW
jgi:hypothetical protein